MDGCWEPWVVGCVIDWEAWAAIGAFLASAAALWIARQSGRDSRMREVAQARVVAGTMVGGIDSLLHEIENFHSLYGTGQPGLDWFDAQYEISAVFRQDVSQKLMRVELLEAERSEHHLYVIPKHSSAKLVKVMNLLRALRKEAARLARSGQPNFDVTDLIPPVQLRARIREVRDEAMALKTDLIAVAAGHSS